MKLLDWIARKQRDKLEGSVTFRSLDDKVGDIERKVTTNIEQQIRASSFSSINQRDLLIVRAPSRDLSEALAVPPVWRRAGGDAK